MSSGADLGRRMDEAWKPFREAVAAAPAAALEDRTPAGWTYKEMLAHVAAWHDLTARRLATFRASGRTEPPTGPDASRVFEDLGFDPADREALLKEWHFDRFNAAVVTAAAGRSVADVLRDLDRSYDAMRAQVASLTDEQCAAAKAEDGRSFVEAVVGGNSFGHYEEHRAEIEELGARVFESDEGA